MFTETKNAGRSFHPQAISLALMAALLAFILAVPAAAAAQETQDAGSANQQGSDDAQDQQQQETGAAEGTGADLEDSRIEVRPGCIRIENPGQLLQVGPSCEEEEGGDGPAGLAEDEESAPQTADGTAATLTDTLETTTGDDAAGESEENASAPTPEEAPEGSARDLLDQIIADCGVEDLAAYTENAEPVPDEKATNTDEKAAQHESGGEGGAVVEGSEDQKEAIEDEDGLSEEECQKLKRALLPENSETGDAAADCPTTPPSDGIRATVAEVIDGDTVRLEEPLDGNDTVRLIGVDVPELEGEDGAPEPYAEAAASFASGALEGREVILEIGEKETDAYGRLLAYVWTAQGGGDATEGDPERTTGGTTEGDPERTDAASETIGEEAPELFNTALLKKGLAKVLIIAPNDLYAGCFEGTEQSARDEGEGIWETENGSPDEGDHKQDASEKAVPEQSAPEQSASEQNVAEAR